MFTVHSATLVFGCALKLTWLVLKILVAASFLQLRREKISERMKLLQDLVPGCSKVSFFSGGNEVVCYCLVFS